LGKVWLTTTAAADDRRKAAYQLTGLQAASDEVFAHCHNQTDFASGMGTKHHQVTFFAGNDALGSLTQGFAIDAREHRSVEGNIASDELFVVKHLINGSEGFGGGLLFAEFAQAFDLVTEHAYALNHGVTT
jgi:hypothetical protein